MRQEEFFQSFQEALSGEVSDGIIQENIAYYKNYLYEETKKGRSVDEVLTSLGNPRLLAKTIINTSNPSYYRSYTEDKSTYDTYNNYHSWEDAKDHRTLKQKLREVKMPKWLRSVLSLLAIIVVIALAFTLISYLAPFILIVACIIAVINLIRRISDGT